MAELTLAIKLTADGKGLVGEVRVSREELEKLKKTTEDGTGASKQAAEAGGRHSGVLQDIQRNARAAVLTIGALSTAIALQTKRWIDDAASMERWHQVTGKSVESLAALKYVAEQTSVSFDLLMATYQRLPKSIVEGLGENSEAGRAFKALAIDPRQLKANDEGMMLIIERLRQVEDRGTRAAIAQMIFKQRGEDLLLWVNQGAEGIRRLTQEGERWATVTGTGAKQADEFKNKVNTLTHATDALAKSVAESVIPVFNTLIERLLRASREGQGFFGTIETFLSATDLAKWERDFAEAAQRLASAQQRVETAQASSGWMRSGLTRAKAELEAARAEVARLQAIKPIMFPEAPAGGAAPGAAAGGLTRQPGLADLEPPDTAGPDLIRQLRDQLAGLNPEITMVDRVMLELTDTTKKYSEVDRAAAIIIADQIDLAKERKTALDAWVVAEEMALAVEQEAADVQARQQDRLNAAVEAIKQENLTENELIQAHLDEKLAMLNQARAMDLISEQMYDEQRYLLEVQAQAKRGDAHAQGVLQRRAFEQMNAQQQTQFVLSEITTLTQGVATHNRTLFNINKVAAIGTAVMQGYLGVSRTLGAYAFPWNVLMGALHAAVAVAQVQKIRSAQFGDSTSAPSVGGGGAIPVTPASGGPEFTPPPSPAAPERVTNISISVPPGNYTAENIRDQMLPAIFEALADGVGRGQINFAVV